MRVKYILGMTILIVIYCLISTVILFLLKKQKKDIIKNAFYILTFFLFLDYFILSVMKYCLGYYAENLYESFWDIQAITIWHYGVPLLIMNIAAAIVVYLFFCKNDILFIRLFDSCMLFVLSFAFFLARKINNKIYCAVYLSALILTIVIVIFIEKKRISFAYDNKSMRAKQAVPVLLYWFITVIIYTPNELYLNNAADFPMSFWPFFLQLLISGIIAFVILLTGMILYLTGRQFDILLTSMFVLLTIGYIQGAILNGSMGVLNGIAKTWGNTVIISNLFVWIILGGHCLLLCCQKRVSIKVDQNN